MSKLMLHHMAADAMFGLPDLDITVGASSECPPATQDIPLNLKNRQRCIQVARYGPPDPSQPNEAFWQAKAEMWGVAPENVKSMRCGNCAAFDVSPHMLSCIAQGLAGVGTDGYDSIKAGQLGYCHFFKFKCAALRTCDAWVAGGPITR
jgi:hypothetical protein